MSNTSLISPLFCNLNLPQLTTSASPTILPILLKVRLLTTALFNVIPLVSFNCNAIVPAIVLIVIIQSVILVEY